VQPRIFLDTADIRQIEKAIQSGVVGGIATNPSKIAETGRSIETVCREITSIFDGPIAVQAVGTTAKELTRHARELNELGPNMAIKIPTTFEGVKAVRELVKEGIQTNCTLIFTPAQALAAGLAGSPIISPFVGRASNIGVDGIGMIAQIRKVYDAFGLDTFMIAASMRNVQQVVEAIIAGADAVAVCYEIFEQMLRHPLTDEGAARFLQDWEGVAKG
jgi:transaldolase